MSAELIVFRGPMFSGKTSSLLMSLEKYKYQGKHIFAFKPQADNRYSVSEIVTHMGWKIPAVTIQSGTDLIKSLIERTPEGENSSNVVVAVDEMFMISGSAEILLWLFKEGATILVSTLDLSSSCKPFDEVTKLLPYATEIVNFVSVCTVCHSDAHYTWKKQENIDSDSAIQVGGSELYEPRCAKHHPAMISGPLLISQQA
jgi:thymidine kinase